MRYKMLASLALAFTFITTHAAAPKYRYNRRGNNKLDAIKFGVKIGPSFANNKKLMKSDPVMDYSIEISQQPHTAFHAGVFGTYKLTDKLDFQLALLYTRKGVEITQTIKPLVDYPLPKVRIANMVNLDYLQATTLINIFPGKDRQFFISLGGYVGYLNSAKAHLDIYKDETKEEPKTINLKEEDTENKLVKYDGGLVLGWGYEFEIGLIFNALADIGLKDLHKDHKGSTNIANHISIGYNFAKLLK